MLPSSLIAALFSLSLVWAAPLADVSSTKRDSNATCDRACLGGIIATIIDSIRKHDPYSLPLAPLYSLTEDSHPAALGFTTLWRTVAWIGEPSLVALDTTNGTAYWSQVFSEGNNETQSILRARIKVEDLKISEFELFINRNRGDHGFSYSPEELPSNYVALMSPPENRTQASRETLWKLSQSLFAEAADATLNVSIGDSCQFTELGWTVVDPGTYQNGSTDPLGCTWPDAHPTDANARVALVIDEELGFVLTSGYIPGIVYPYGFNLSAFIPDSLSVPQEAQVEYLEEMLKEGIYPQVAPFAGTGDTLELLQYYDDALQAMQINVYMNPPNATSPWL